MDTTLLMALDKLAGFSIKVGLMIVALTAFMRLGVGMGRDQVMELIPREQRAVVQRVLRSGINRSEIEKCQKELKEAQAAIEAARRAITSGLRDDALNWIINARGHLAKVNKKAFDITKLQAELQLVQRTMFSPRAQ